MDYRQVNAVTVKDAYPLPRIDNSLCSLSGAKWFSTLDLASGYWQVPMDPASSGKAAFVTTSGLYEWNVIPFGLTSSPSTFERLMELILAGLRFETCLIYLDDTIVYGRTFQEELERLEEVFVRFASAGLKLKPSKCSGNASHILAILYLRRASRLTLRRFNEFMSGQCLRMQLKLRAF